MGAVTRRNPQFSRLEGQARRHRPDYWLIVLSALLLAIGLVVVYSISPGLAVEKSVGQSYFINRQLVWVGLGALAFLITAHLPLTTWQRLQKPLLIAAIAAAIIVRLFGEEVNGAYRWIQVGGMSFQAVELIKFAVLIWLAGFLTERIREGNLGDWRTTLKPLMIALGVVGVVVAGLQSDFGSTVVIIAMMAAMVVIAGLPMKRILAIGGVVLILGTMAIASSSYRQDRLLTFLHPTQDCLSTGYQACQALIAVGSGGLFGLGLGNSVQAFGYLPEAENDSIFAIYAEKFGFVGVTVLLGLLVAFFSRLYRIIARAPDTFTRLLTTGVFAWLAAQAIINIGAMIGLLPLKGITLPFISYGGTSVVFTLAAIGIVFQISRYSLYSVPRDNVNGGNRYDPRAVRPGATAEGPVRNMRRHA